MEDGDVTSFFVDDLGLALAPNMCPDQSQAFEEVTTCQAFTTGRKKAPILFMNEPLPGAPRHFCTTFSASVRSTDRVRPILGLIYHPKSSLH